MHGVMPPNWVLPMKMGAFNAKGDRDHNDIGQLIWRHHLARNHIHLLLRKKCETKFNINCCGKMVNEHNWCVRTATATISTNLVFELRHRMHSASIGTERWICYSCSETLTTTIYGVSNLANEHNHTIESYEFQFDRLVFTLFCCALHFYEQIFFDFRFMLT